MTEEKFKKFQDALSLLIAHILLMEEDKFVAKKIQFTDKIGKEYSRKATQRAKEDRQFIINILIYNNMITQIVKEYFK